MKTFWISLLTILLLSQANIASTSENQQLDIAVAANFVRPIEELIDIFVDETGIVLKPTYSSTGKFYAQIRNGAPFDVFLAADCRRPDLLYREGLAEKPIVYARGQAVLWTGIKELCSEPTWKVVIKRNDIKKISISNPETAPYGDAAASALKKAGIWKDVVTKLIFAQSVGQAFQYAEMGGADIGFTALSYALSNKGRKGCWWPLTEAPAVIQEACILKVTRNRAAAKRFLRFLTSDKAKPVLKRYGYR